MGLTSSSVAEEDLRDELETNERTKTQIPSGASTAAPRAPSMGNRCSSTRHAPLLLACRRQVLFLPSLLFIASPETSSCFPFLHYVSQPSRRVFRVMLGNITLSFCFVFLSPTGHFGIMFRVHLMECFAAYASFTYKVPCAYHPGEPQVCILCLTVV